MSGKIERFEDFIAWQKAKHLAVEMYSITRKGEWLRDYAFRDQVRRSVISISANIAEGFERGKPSEFHQFLCIAKGSCAEFRSHLHIAWEVGYLNRETFLRLLASSEELGRILGGLRLSVERRRYS